MVYWTHLETIQTEKSNQFDFLLSNNFKQRSIFKNKNEPEMPHQKQTLEDKRRDILWVSKR